MTLKIGFVTTNMKWGGSEDLWSETLKTLFKKGIDVSVNLPQFSPQPQIISDLVNSGCSMYFKKNSEVKAYSLTERVVNKFQRIFQKDYAWLDSFNPDLVVISQGNLLQGLDWKRECIKRSIPYVSIVQAVIDFHLIEDNFADQLCEVYQKAITNYFVSENNLNLTNKLLGTQFNNSEIVRNPFKVPYTPKLSYPSLDPQLKLAVVGALNIPHKGQDLLFEVLKQDKWKNRNLTVSLYGSGPSERILKRLKELWQLEQVEFKGFTNNILEIWQENHGLLMGSRLEGLPLAVVEAMLCQRIAIVPDIGGNGEVIRDNENGFLALAPTVFCIDEAMERAWQRREEWETLGKIAAQDIRQIIPENPAQIFAEKLLNLL